MKIGTDYCDEPLIKSFNLFIWDFSQEHFLIQFPGAEKLVVTRYFSFAFHPFFRSTARAGGKNNYIVTLQ